MTTADEIMPKYICWKNPCMFKNCIENLGFKYLEKNNLERSDVHVWPLEITFDDIYHDGQIGQLFPTMIWQIKKW